MQVSDAPPSLSERPGAPASDAAAADAAKARQNNDADADDALLAAALSGRFVLSAEEVRDFFVTPEGSSDLVWRRRA